MGGIGFDGGGGGEVSKKIVGSVPPMPPHYGKSWTLGSPGPVSCARFPYHIPYFTIRRDSISNSKAMPCAISLTTAMFACGVKSCFKDLSLRFY